MSWDLKEIKENGTTPSLTVTSFYGGARNGRCLQIAQTVDGDARGHQYIQLTRTQLLELVERIEGWDSGKYSEHDPEGEMRSHSDQPLYITGS